MKQNRSNGWLKVLLILFTINCSLFTATAQQTDFQQACTRYKDFKQAVANINRIIHKKSLKKDIVTTGGACIMAPDMVSISTNEGRDKLLMKGTRFTMTVNGKEHSTVCHLPHRSHKCHQRWNDRYHETSRCVYPEDRHLTIHHCHPNDRQCQETKENDVFQVRSCA